MKLALAFVILAACGGDKPAPAPVSNQQTPPPPAEADPQHDANLRAERAERAADEAVKAAREAEERVDKIAADLEALDRRLSAAVDQVVAAQTDAERAAAKAKLQDLQREKAEMDQRIREAKASAMKAQRSKGVTISKECIDNPLAKGCS